MSSDERDPPLLLFKMVSDFNLLGHKVPLSCSFSFKVLNSVAFLFNVFCVEVSFWDVKSIIFKGFSRKISCKQRAGHSSAKPECENFQERGPSVVWFPDIPLTVVKSLAKLYPQVRPKKTVKGVMKQTAYLGFNLQSALLRIYEGVLIRAPRYAVWFPNVCDNR